VSVKPGKNIVKFLKYFVKYFKKYFKAKKFMKFYITTPNFVCTIAGHGRVTITVGNSEVITNHSLFV